MGAAVEHEPDVGEVDALRHAGRQRGLELRVVGGSVDRRDEPERVDGLDQRGPIVCPGVVGGRRRDGEHEPEAAVVEPRREVAHEGRQRLAPRRGDMRVVKVHAGRVLRLHREHDRLDVLGGEHGVGQQQIERLDRRGLAGAHAQVERRLGRLAGGGERIRLARERPLALGARGRGGEHGDDAGAVQPGGIGRLARADDQRQRARQRRPPQHGDRLWDLVHVAAREVAAVHRADRGDPRPLAVLVAVEGEVPRVARLLQQRDGQRPRPLEPVRGADVVEAAERDQTLRHGWHLVARAWRDAVRVLAAEHAER